jgi:hypothetical protein
MSFFDGPKVVTRGLILSLDASDRNSYSGTGTTWTDLTGNGYNGTLTNGPVFSTSNNGILTFNSGSSQYVNFGNVLNFERTDAFSVFFWIKAPTPGPSSFFPVINKLNWVVGAKGWRISSQAGVNYLSMTIADNHTVTDINLTVSNVLDDTWHCVCFTYNGNGVTNGMVGYLDSVLQASGGGGNLTTTSTSTTSLQIFGVSASSIYSLGSLGNMLVYNRALSASEVIQNYESQKLKYQDRQSIVTNGLRILLDSTDPGSYPGTGTSWTDLSGNGRTATMFGAVPYQSDVVNCFNFAGATGASSLSSTLGFTFASNMIPTTGNFTLSCWIKNPNSGNGGQIGLFANAGGADGYRFGVGTTGVYYLIGPSFQEGNIAFGSTLSTNLWYNVTAVYNRTGTTVSVYLNGVFQNSASIPAQSAFTNTTPGLVRSPCCGIYTGKLAIFSAYGKALTQAEITQNYEAFKSKFGL